MSLSLNPVPRRRMLSVRTAPYSINLDITPSPLAVTSGGTILCRQGARLTFECIGHSILSSKHRYDFRGLQPSRCVCAIERRQCLVSAIRPYGIYSTCCYLVEKHIYQKTCELTHYFETLQLRILHFCYDNGNNVTQSLKACEIVITL
jgi:hypothetical protein